MFVCSGYFTGIKINNYHGRIQETEYGGSYKDSVYLLMGGGGGGGGGGSISLPYNGTYIMVHMRMHNCTLKTTAVLQY